MEQELLAETILRDKKKRGLSWRKMADYLRVPHMTLYRMVKGYRYGPIEYGLEYQERLCKHYGLLYIPTKQQAEGGGEQDPATR